MDTDSGLAAVHAAATSVAPAALPAVVATAAAQQPTTIADLTAAFPDLCAQIRADGATAERSRILGIEAQAMSGHEALIAQLKADPSVTAEMAAIRVINAEKQLRAGHLQAVQDVEKVTGKLAAAPVAAVTRVEEQPERLEAASTPDGWKAEWEASKQLQAEFGRAEHYVAFKKAEAGGQVRILGVRKSA